MKIVLLEPEIPQNTGNISRTCAVIGAELHLIEPLGFSLEEKMVRRAGLDYWHLVTVVTHPNFESFLAAFPDLPKFYVTTKGNRLYTQVDYPQECALIFGKESAGLPEDLLRRHPDTSVRIPLVAQARSMNLANAVAVMSFEVLRQNEFPGLERAGSPRSFEWSD